MVCIEEFVSLRIPKRAMRIVHRLKAHFIRQREQKVSDSTVVVEVLNFASQNERKLFSGKKVSLGDYIGFIKDGKPSNVAQDLDAVLYGE